MAIKSVRLSDLSNQTISLSSEVVAIITLRVNNVFQHDDNTMSGLIALKGAGNSIKVKKDISKTISSKWMVVDDSTIPKAIVDLYHNKAIKALGRAIHNNPKPTSTMVSKPIKGTPRTIQSRRLLSTAVSNPKLGRLMDNNNKQHGNKVMKYFKHSPIIADLSRFEYGITPSITTKKGK